jgi:FemAB-related protein (PEP-CTERM system-associated)
MRISELTPDLEAGWEAFVQRHDDASTYHQLVWRDLIGEVFGHPAHYLVSTADDGRVTGCLPLIEMRSRLFGHFLVSMPFFNYGGALAIDTATEMQLMQAAGRLAERLGAGHVEFRDHRPRDGDWAVRDDKVAMQLSLPDSVDALWSQIGSKVRAQVRRPQREPVHVASGGIELTDDFYRVFSRNMRDLGTPVYPKALFAAVLRALGERAFVTVVYLHDQPVAAGLLVGWRGRLEIPWASSLREHNRLGINMLLYWEVLKRAVELGYQTFDFGRSSVDSGTFRFKRQWGAEPVPLHWHYWLPQGRALPALNPDNPRYRMAIQCWQRLPLPVANLMGPHIVRNLP